jgi:hypothetical protein
MDRSLRPIEVRNDEMVRRSALRSARSLHVVGPAHHLKRSCYIQQQEAWRNDHVDLDSPHLPVAPSFISLRIPGNATRSQATSISALASDATPGERSTFSRAIRLMSEL